jgi:8-oxo-dGTP diphosphatase
MAEKVQQVHIVAGGLLERDGKFLLVNAKIGVPKGLWNLPAGRVGEGETIEETAVREVKEETGLDVKIQGIVGVYHRLKNKYGNNMIRVNFRMEILGGELNPPEDEISEAGWFSLEEIKAMPDSGFAFATKECVLDYSERGFVKQGMFSTRSGDAR